MAALDHTFQEGWSGHQMMHAAAPARDCFPSMLPVLSNNQVLGSNMQLDDCQSLCMLLQQPQCHVTS